MTADDEEMEEKEEEQKQMSLKQYVMAIRRLEIFMIH
jgi:hypothetical protein